MLNLRAILVSVDYNDILSITLPYNRHHFKDVMVVTSVADAQNVWEICKPLDVSVHATNAFYEDGAQFNKWKALEEGLEVFGRKGWIIMRAKSELKRGAA